MSQILHPGLSLRNTLGYRYASSNFFKTEGAFSAPFPVKPLNTEQKRRNDFSLTTPKAERASQASYAANDAPKQQPIINNAPSHPQNQNSSAQSNNPLSSTTSPAIPRSRTPSRKQQVSHLDASCVPYETYTYRRMKGQSPAPSRKEEEWMFV